MKNSKIKALISFLLVSLSASFVSGQDISKNTDKEYKTVENIFYREGQTELTEYAKSRCMLDIYYPENIKDFSTVVWFHGGGLRGGEKFIPEELKRNGIAVVAVNYRLFPQIKAPVYIEDAAASVAWVFKNITKYGGSNRKIFVSGHSAGGYLTSMIGLDKKWLKKYDIDADSIAGLIPYSGHAITHLTVREERGIDGKQPIVDDLAPLYHVRNDAPPLVLITGDRNLELLGRYEENAYLMRMMKVAGHQQTLLYELDGFDHRAMAKPAHHILLNFIKKLSAE